MAHIYTTIKRHKGIEYVFIQNKSNSRHSYIEAYDRKTNQLINLVAEIDNKTHTITYTDTESPIPQLVKDIIEKAVV